MQTFEPVDPAYSAKVHESFSRQQFMIMLGASIADLKPGYCEVHVPYRADLTQQHNFFHAGVSGAIADSAAGYAAFSLMPADASVLTVEYKLNLVAAARGDRLVARARVLRSGRTLKVCASDVYVIQDGRETLCATSLSTIMTMVGKADH